MVKFGKRQEMQKVVNKNCFHGMKGDKTVEGQSERRKKINKYCKGE